MRIFLKFLAFIFLIAIFSCRKDFSTIPSNGTLTFSKDTVFLDTVFTNIGSSTYSFKVYNKSNKAISIPTIKLGRGESSFYRLNVDGKPGKNFENVEILAKDSIFIFVETTIDYNQVVNPIYTDSVVFDNGNNLQNVKLVTLVKDAHFLFPSKYGNGFIETIKIGVDSVGNDIKVNGFYLNGNTTFTKDKPYVIYGYCAVPNYRTLTIEPGTHIYFHKNSGLIVNNRASLKIEGELNKEVILEGDRLEPEYNNVAGQWGSIWLRAGSSNNQINYAIIKNATIGIIADSISSTSTPTLTIKNTQIYNNSNYGILARETAITGENLVINNNGQSSLACTIGGTYNFIHCTFANYWNKNFRNSPTVLINNYYTYSNNGKIVVETSDLKAANFLNCVIDGTNSTELVLNNQAGSLFNFSFKNCFIKFKDVNSTFKDIAEYNFNDTIHYQDNIFEGKPDYKNPDLNELIIGNNSDLNDRANSLGSQIVPYDILGISRPNQADIGAYQHANFN